MSGRGEGGKETENRWGGKGSNEASSLPASVALRTRNLAVAAAVPRRPPPRSRSVFRRAGGIVIIVKGTLIKTRTTRRAPRSASGAAPGTRRPRPRRHRRRRRLPDRRRSRRRRRSDYLALHLGTSERARRRCQLRFKSHSALRNATRPACRKSRESRRDNPPPAVDKY